MANNVIIKKNDIPKLLRDNPNKFDKALTAFCFDGKRYVRQIIKDSPPTGNVYMKPSGVSHTASSPGNPPRIDDGILINSITFRKIGEMVRLFEAGAEHAIELEFGTSKMEARPFFGPMVGYMSQNVKPFFEGLIED